ncbi:MAG: Uma2 family endonuclease [Thermomicrobiales bacterium]
MPSLPRLVTAAELDDYPDDGKRYEVIGGQLYVWTTPMREHQELSGRLFYQVYKSAESSHWGKAYFLPVNVRFSDYDQVQPDIIVLRTDHDGVYRGNTVFGPPDVVIEILSPPHQAFDEVEKFRLYETNGVPEYWIGDPDLPNLRLFALRDGVYVPIPPESGLLRSTVVPNLTVDPEKLLANLGQ